VRLVVDGMNVIGSRPDGWWRDRAGAQRRLVGELGAWAASNRRHDVIVVFDGHPKRDERAAEQPGVEVRFAPGGPNAADAAIVALVEADTDPGAVTVVTSDRALADAVRALGATVEGVAAFRRRLAD
jgi:predicted RNA-binding protein with PIN domain